MRGEVGGQGRLRGILVGGRRGRIMGLFDYVLGAKMSGIYLKWKKTKAFNNQGNNNHHSTS